MERGGLCPPHTPGIYRLPPEFDLSYAVTAGTEDKAPQGCDLSAVPVPEFGGVRFTAP